MDKTADLRKLAELTKGIRTCMFATLDEEGRPHARPMATQEITADGEVHFLTSRSSLKAHEVAREHTVCLSYADEAGARYVSMTGQATVRDDRAKIRELWNPLYNAWFPQGVDDPDLVLLAVAIEEAEYWDSPGGRVVQLLRIARQALAGGEKSDDKPGRHGHLDVQPNH